MSAIVSIVFLVIGCIFTVFLVIHAANWIKGDLKSNPGRGEYHAKTILLFGFLTLTTEEVIVYSLIGAAGSFSISAAVATLFAGDKEDETSPDEPRVGLPPGNEE